MPTILIEAPTGIRRDAKKRLVEKTTAALNEAYPIPDVRIFLREYQADNVSQDGRLESELVRRRHSEGAIPNARRNASLK
jgi:phenylpyruvate tautomerase PptA (4-oxalocrotonate tautomerase family)